MGHNLNRLQRSIQKYYHRNKGVLDTLSKLQISAAKTGRNVIQAATQCGCIEIQTRKQPPELSEEADSMLKGCLCEVCRDKIEQSMGDTLFYLVSLMLLTDTDADMLIEKQNQQIEWLGKFNLK